MVYWQLKVLCCYCLCSHWQDKELSGNLIVAQGVDGWRGGGEGPVRDTPAGKWGVGKQTDQHTSTQDAHHKHLSPHGQGLGKIDDFEVLAHVTHTGFQ